MLDDRCRPGRRHGASSSSASRKVLSTRTSLKRLGTAAVFSNATVASVPNRVASITALVAIELADVDACASRLSTADALGAAIEQPIASRHRSKTPDPARSLNPSPYIQLIQSSPPRSNRRRLPIRCFPDLSRAARAVNPAPPARRRPTPLSQIRATAQICSFSLSSHQSSLSLPQPLSCSPSRPPAFPPAMSPWACQDQSACHIRLSPKPRWSVLGRRSARRTDHRQTGRRNRPPNPPPPSDSTLLPLVMSLKSAA